MVQGRRRLFAGVILAGFLGAITAVVARRCGLSFWPGLGIAILAEVVFLVSYVVVLTRFGK